MDRSTPRKEGGEVSPVGSTMDELYPEYDGRFSYDPKCIDTYYATVGIEGHRYHINSLKEYQDMHKLSLEDPEKFWGDMALQNLRIIQPYTKVVDGSLDMTDYCWFLNGKINACDNCVDRWAEAKPDATAIIYEGDDPTQVRKITFRMLKNSVCRYANVLKAHGVRKGDTVTIYMPNIPELAFTILACTRIGAVHSVVFGGFSAASIAERIKDASSRIVVTIDETTRGGKHLKMKNIIDETLKMCPEVERCLVFRNMGTEVNMVDGRDVWLNEAILKVRPYCPIEPMDSEDVMFLLYTSGSTGKPKGVAHTTMGYMLYAFATTKYIFDVFPGDVFGCMADIGWITGHTYIIYGPLLNGLTTFMFASLPTYPDPGRYWRMVEQHRITQFYTAPTAIRELMRHGDDIPAKYDTSSLRILGSVGEPINPEAWRWYHDLVGKGRATVVDTYWQTETGGIVVAPLPGVIPTKPGCATVPFFGIDVGLLDPNTGTETTENSTSGLLVIKRPWPGLFRTLFGNHQRGVNTYFAPFKGMYLTGDAAYRDKDGYIWINGRVDDTVNVSGHLIGSAEIEHAIVQVNVVAEAAVVGFPHPIKGQGIFCFVILRKDTKGLEEDEIIKKLTLSVRQLVGPFATPDIIATTPFLPKTRSGKIMRRILRKLVSNQFDDLGDTTTLSDPTVIEGLVDICRKALNKFSDKLRGVRS